MRIRPQTVNSGLTPTPPPEIKAHEHECTHLVHWITPKCHPEGMLWEYSLNTEGTMPCRESLPRLWVRRNAENRNCVPQSGEHEVLESVTPNAFLESAEQGGSRQCRKLLWSPLDGSTFLCPGTQGTGGVIAPACALIKHLAHKVSTWLSSPRQVTVVLEETRSLASSLPSAENPKEVGSRWFLLTLQSTLWTPVLTLQCCQEEWKQTSGAPSGRWLQLSLKKSVRTVRALHGMGCLPRQGPCLSPQDPISASIEGNLRWMELELDDHPPTPITVHLLSLASTYTRCWLTWNRCTHAPLHLLSWVRTTKPGGPFIPWGSAVLIKFITRARTRLRMKEEVIMWDNKAERELWHLN